MSRQTLAFIILLCGLPVSVIAQDWYEIEVLVFEHTNNYYGSTDPERWPNNIELAWPSPLIQLDTGNDEFDRDLDLNTDTDTDPNQPKEEQRAGIEKPFTPLADEQRRLGNANYALRNRNGYRLLWHEAWKAPMLNEETAPWILIQADELLDGHFRLEGAIRIHLSRYLHLSTNLWLTELQPQRRGIEQTGFHWSQLPSITPVQKPCTFVALDWPKNKQLGAKDYYDKQPSPGWYYPYGCDVQFEKARHAEKLERQALFLNGVAGDGTNTGGTNIGGINNERLGDPETTLRLNEQQDSLSTHEQKVLPRTTQDQPINGSLRPEQRNARASSTPNFGKTLPSDENSVRQQKTLNSISQSAELVYNEQSGRYESRGRYEGSISAAHPVEQIIHINSQRRMRSKELHYIDHPKIGILIIAHPVDKPKGEEKPAEFIPAPLPTPNN